MQGENEFVRVTKCQVCYDSRLHDFLNLGLNPDCNVITEEEIGTPNERAYPLSVCYCENCWCVQTRFIVNPKILFGERYHHVAGIPLAFRKNAHDLAESAANRFKLASNDLVVDIGSNDGTLLGEFKQYSPRILGIDPSEAANLAMAKGIPTEKVFFGEEAARGIAARHGQARVITAQNTFAHVANLESFMKGIKILLQENGSFITESHYLLDLVGKLQYDFFYHEHLRYYSVTTLVHLFKLYGMDVFDVQRIQMHAGSIRVFACNKGAFPAAESVKDAMRMEREAGLFAPRTYEDFARRAQQHAVELREMIDRLKGDRSRVVGITYPCRGLTLLQYCKIGPNQLEYITDNTPSKVGKYVPRARIKIVDQEVLFQDQPDFGLLMSWHLADEIIPRFRARGFKGKFIVPLPRPTIR